MKRCFTEKKKTVTMSPTPRHSHKHAHRTHTHKQYKCTEYMREHQRHNANELCAAHLFTYCSLHALNPDSLISASYLYMNNSSHSTCNRNTILGCKRNARKKKKKTEIQCKFTRVGSLVLYKKFFQNNVNCCTSPFDCSARCSGCSDSIRFSSGINSDLVSSNVSSILY